jgi:hypothetical protein
MKTITFDHTKKNVIEACDILCHKDFIVSTLIKTSNDVLFKPDYIISQALEDIAESNRVHLKMGTDIPILDEEILPIYIAFKLGEILTHAERIENEFTPDILRALLQNLKR